MEQFDALMRSYRQSAGLSQNELARRAGVDPAYVNRMERANGPIPRPAILNALMNALTLEQSQIERLLVAAGYCPQSVAKLGTWDQTLGIVADVLAAPELSQDAREEFRQVIKLVASRWLAVA
jgi:transcriptional regulator with XRE-family HTH domain